MIRGVVAILIGMLMCAAVASGCGGGDNDDDSLAKAEFRQQANAICKEREDEKNNALQTAINDPKELQGDSESIELKLLEEVALPPIVAMTEELDDLGLPEGEEEKAESMLKAFEEEIEVIEANPKSVVSGEGGEFTRANKLATDLGLDACAAI